MRAVVAVVVAALALLATGCMPGGAYGINGAVDPTTGRVELGFTWTVPAAPNPLAEKNGPPTP